MNFKSITLLAILACTLLNSLGHALRHTTNRSHSGDIDSIINAFNVKQDNMKVWLNSVETGAYVCKIADNYVAKCDSPSDSIAQYYIKFLGGNNFALKNVATGRYLSNAAGYIIDGPENNVGNDETFEYRYMPDNFSFKSLSDGKWVQIETWENNKNLLKTAIYNIGPFEFFS